MLFRSELLESSSNALNGATVPVGPRNPRLVSASVRSGFAMISTSIASELVAIKRRIPDVYHRFYLPRMLSAVFTTIHNTFRSYISDDVVKCRLAMGESGIRVKNLETELYRKRQSLLDAMARIALAIKPVSAHESGIAS